ncbi:insulinase family protein [Lachnotalea glycerini]|uniref:Insulinase family protein n=2 Tax=Lachnotalea glycerini TaxID=1763509 RepID=A0A371JKC8_9FIRM|nr:insulinase family protein [Lachnotalea glycerini]
MDKNVFVGNKIWKELFMINCFKLSNHIKVVCEPMPYLRSVSLGIWVKAGSVNESLELNGISHVIEHMLFKGTKTKSAKEIADITTSLGGNLNAFTSKEYTSYYICTLDKHLDASIELLSDMLINSTISNKDIEKEKSVILDEIDMYEDSPEEMVHEVLQQYVWKDNSHGYIISGDKDTVKSFTKAQIINFKNYYYTGENIVISVAGSFEQDRLIDKLERFFGQIPLKGSSNAPLAPIFTRCDYQKNKDIEQAHLNIAYEAISALSPKRYAFSIVNSVLGGSVNSRLFQRIREEEGMVYSIYSYQSSYDQCGLFQIYAAMNPGLINAVLDEIYATIDEFVKMKISNSELNNAREEIKTELIINAESTQCRMENNAKSLLQFDKIISMDETIKALDMVTVDDTALIIDQYIRNMKPATAIIGKLD